MRYSTEHKRRTHDKIIKEAAKAIRQHGPEKIGIAALMNKVGLTHGGFYAHFKSKDMLVAEAITHMFDDRYKVFLNCMAGVEPAAGVNHYIDLYLSPRHRDGRNIGCPAVALAGDLARMPVVARRRFESGMQRLVDSLAEVFMLLDRPEPHALAASVLSEMIGAVSIARAVAGNDFSEQILNAARSHVKQRIFGDSPVVDDAQAGPGPVIN